MRKVGAISLVVALAVLGVLAVNRLPQLRQRWIEQRFLEAVRSNSFARFNNLLKANVFTNLQLAVQQKVICRAVGGGRDEMIQLLQRHGARFDFMDADGFTPMHLAAGGNGPEVVSFLISNGCPVDSPIRIVVNNEATEGFTPLGIAAHSNRSRSVEIASLLLKAGAEPFRGMADPFPFRAAVQSGNTNMAGLMLAYMTNVTFSPQEQQEVLSWTPGFGSTQREREEGKDMVLVLSNHFARAQHSSKSEPKVSP